MTTLSDRVLEAMKDAGFPSQTALARAAGIPQPTINRIINKVGAAPEMRTLFGIARACGVSVQWLIDGSGPKSQEEMMRSQGVVMYKDVVSYSAEDKRFATIRKVKLRLSAGIVGFATEEPEEDAEAISVDLRWVERRKFRLEALIALEIKGQSMEPMLFDGDNVIVNTADKTPVDGAVFAVNYEGEAVIKRMSRDAGNWWLTSDNPDQRRFHRKLCKGEDCIVVGRVVQRVSEQL